MKTIDKAVLALQAQRDKGIAKYGGELSETKPSALELAVHAKEEAADFLQYAVELEERIKLYEPIIQHAKRLYWSHVTGDGSGSEISLFQAVEALVNTEIEIIET